MTITIRTERLRFAQWKRANDVRYSAYAALTGEQHTAASYGYPGLTPDEAAYFVHVSEVYVRAAELRNLDAYPGDESRDYEQQYRDARHEDMLARHRFGGRCKPTVAARLRVAKAAAYDRECAVSPF